jgi:hypothetical protein
MPFSSLSDPSDLARACAVLDAAWDEFKDSIPEAQRDAERRTLAYLVTSLSPLALDDDDLRRNVIFHFKRHVLQTVRD